MITVSDIHYFSKEALWQEQCDSGIQFHSLTYYTCITIIQSDLTVHYKDTVSTSYENNFMVRAYTCTNNSQYSQQNTCSYCMNTHNQR